jgi:NadR type nicotinamide-nucleotide adenylyltransferase
MVKKIIITGPESTGKTTLATQLAEVLDTQWVPEFARQYLDKLDAPYQESDLLEIAKGQIKSEENFLKKVHQYLVCDTDLITLKIWSEYKFGRCHDFILKNMVSHQREYYLLSYPDLPWVYDPQRENPDDRLSLYELYKGELEYYKKPYFELRGNGEERLATALKQIRKLE